MKPKQYQNIVFLTGAGISAPSGIPTFRGSNGLWNNYPLEDVATIEAFRRNPNYVHKFINELKPTILETLPNAAHYAITDMQKLCLNANIDVITQNIDTLHEKAGNNHVHHIHGRIDNARCERCGCILDVSKLEVNTKTICPSCKTIGRLKPHIVFFHEPILYTSIVDKLLEKVDLFIAVGTSGNVFPAAGFTTIAKQKGAKTILFDIEPSANPFFDEQIIGDASETLPKFVEERFAIH